MGFSALSRIFQPFRHRLRAANVGFAVPALQEIDLAEDLSPMLATNMRRSFVPVLRGSAGQVRSGFSECPLNKESSLFRTFVQSVLDQGVKSKWKHRCSTVDEAFLRMEGAGLTPRFVVLSETALPRYLPSGYNVKEVRKLMRMQGFIGSDGDIHYLLAPLPPKTILVTAKQESVGLYTRTGEYVSILATRVDRTLLFVNQE